MTIPALLFAAVVGFNHAFEADHVLAVGNLANKRQSFLAAIKDGLFWGLGHTSMILVVGCIIIIGKLTLNIAAFDYLEVVVGITLIALGVYRLTQIKQRSLTKDKAVVEGNKLAYSIGLIHGLAGSGAVVLIAMSEIQSSAISIIYMLLFGAGSILGMMIVAILFKLPVGSKAKVSTKIQQAFLWLSGILCIGYGIFMVFKFLG